MRQKQKHIIQKLVVDLEYNGKAAGLELQNEISRWCRDYLLPYLEALLDDDETVDTVKRI